MLSPVARAETPPAPRTILILFDALTADDLRDPALPHLRALAQSGGVGLMNTAVAGPKTDTAAVLTLALGAQAPAEPTDEEVYLNRSEWVESAPAGIVFQRRTGIRVNESSDNRVMGNPTTRSPDHPTPQHLNTSTPERLVHLGIASLKRRGLNHRLIGAVLARAGKTEALRVGGNADTDRPGRRAALFVVNADGIGPYGPVATTSFPDSPAMRAGKGDIDGHNGPAPLSLQGRKAGDEGGISVQALAQWAAEQHSSVVVHLGDGARVEAMRSRLEAAAYARARRAALTRLDELLSALTPLSLPRSRVSARGAGGREGDPVRILLLSPRPPANERGEWDRLTPVVLAGADATPGLLTSATTRTPGLIANVDIAPTLLQWLDVPVPAAMTGHPLSIVPSGDPLAEIARLDRLVTVNARALVPIFALLGVCAAAVVLGGLAASWQRSAFAPTFALGILFLMNMPLAMLLVVFLAPTSVITLIVWTLALMLLGTGAELLGSQSPLQRVAFLTVLVILVDAFFGQPLVKFSVFSAYQLPGLRFYGIGNEYMGVLIGLTLLWMSLGRMSARWAGAVFLGVALVIGFPRLGANAGGLVAAAAAFGCGWMIRRGRRVDAKAAALWTLGGLAGAFTLAALERSIFGSESSHLGGALQAAGTQGYGYLPEIVARKLLMNARILLHPAALAALASIAALLLLARRTLRARTQTLLAQHPTWSSGLPAAGFGALAAFLFNDSGIVAALFLLGAFLMAGLYFLFTDPVSDSPSSV